MKSMIIATTLLAAQAFAYNSTYVPVQFGKHTQVETRTKALYNATLVSLKLDLNSKTGAQPLVMIANQDQKNCSHKQTILLYSGYDMVTKTYKRTYEVQVQRDPARSCYLAIYGSTSNQDKMKAARVSILPSK